MKSGDGQQPVTLDSVHQRSILEVFHNSLLDRPERGGGENEVRYKLIIDPSEDSSLVQLLMTFEVLDRKKTHVYVCSDFPGDSQVQKVSLRDNCEYMYMYCNILMLHLFVSVNHILKSFLFFLYLPPSLLDQYYCCNTSFSY